MQEPQRKNNEVSLEGRLNSGRTNRFSELVSFLVPGGIILQGRNDIGKENMDKIGYTILIAAEGGKLSAYSQIAYEVYKAVDKLL